MVMKVKDLAALVDVSTDRLLSQIAWAGLPQISSEEPVTDHDKLVPLAFLKNGCREPSPRIIALLRALCSISARSEKRLLEKISINNQENKNQFFQSTVFFRQKESILKKTTKVFLS